MQIWIVHVYMGKVPTTLKYLLREMLEATAT